MRRAQYYTITDRFANAYSMGAPVVSTVTQ